MATSTPYLRLAITPVNNQNWYAAYLDNLAKIDKLGQALRLQTGAGKSMAIRAMLSTGALVDAIKVVPAESGDSLSIILGRAGKNDKVVIESSSLFSSLNMSNQNVTATDKTCSIGVTWADEDGALGDGVQDTTVILDVRNNLRTLMIFPPASQHLVTQPNPYLGSALQLGTDQSGTGAGTPHIRFVCETTSGPVTYIVPAYKL